VLVPLPPAPRPGDESWARPRKHRSLLVRVIRIILGGLTALFLAFVVYVYGTVRAEMFSLSSTDQICRAHPFSEYRDLSQSLLPLSTRCYWTDGTSTQLVPPWVNPAFFTLLGLGTIGPVVALSLLTASRPVSPR
jgi:hypothetical protein